MAAVSGFGGAGVDCIGVLLAAGRGRRAGGSKQLLAWVTEAGVQPLVAASFDAVAPVCRAMVVVLGHEPLRVRGALGARAYTPVEADPDAPMSESMRAGLAEAIRTIDQAGDDARRCPESWILLQPGDHPAVAHPTLRRLCAIAKAEGSRGRAVVPEFMGRGGHPTLIPASVARQIIVAPLDGGLRQFWVDRPGLCVRVVVADAGVVRDLDRWPAGGCV